MIQVAVIAMSEICQSIYNYALCATNHNKGEFIHKTTPNSEPRIMIEST